MFLKQTIDNKALKPKEKTIAISQWLLEEPQRLSLLIEFAKNAKDPVKATCIESIEFATKLQPTIANLICFEFITASLASKAPRVKWESAKVIGNIAFLFPVQLEEAIRHLFENTEHSGTVVRWSAAFALGEILQLRTRETLELIPAIKVICEREEKNSIKKIYQTALKKIKA